jgi:integrase
MPASGASVAAYVDDVVDRHRVATVRRRLAAIRARHVDRGRRSPTDDAVVRAAVARAEWRRRDDHRPTAPLGVAELRAVSGALPDDLAGKRDRSLLLLGYGAGLRPGEIVALGADDVRIVRGGLAVRVARGDVVVPHGSDDLLCAVQAWSAWAAASMLQGGPAYRPIDRHGRLGGSALGTKAVTRVVQRAAARAGLDPARYSGRSLRRGMVLAATEQGATEGGIMAHTGHRSRRLVRRYMQESPTDQ